MKYYVIETACFPNAFKVTYDFANTKDMADNAGCNYFPTEKEAQAEADKRNKNQVKSHPFTIARGFGSISNSIITRRNGGVVHQFLNDIGGCSDNYR
jgi:hypothetical protein